ncbi:TPA: hypothetical protein ACGN6M_000110 [Streptococcus agalactiae]|uniref:hypothetical protein n=1 Tax=Bacillota TaxID=1239 RepID=UPI0003714591|nr:MULTISPECIES: hypothetical protein [Bacillota]MBY0585236.1 hypothetical protein [Murdochiella sp. Marseille-P8839]MED5846020.1 hypothetical protein [Streptococcus anginosus]HEO4577941.1 hypothetical protein [Streptococcus agalactiae]HES5977266.1 hypothetical protein [Streptococcus pyogenes]MED5853561.1 hypothetical protein [Streptococcus anginosus]
MDEIIEMLTEVGLPFAYDHFEEGQAPDPPFICYVTPESHNFAADGQVYFPVNRFYLELYTDKKDRALEKRIEDLLIRHDQFFDKAEVYINAEDLYEVSYSFELKG